MGRFGVEISSSPAAVGLVVCVRHPAFVRVGLLLELLVDFLFLAVG